MTTPSSPSQEPAVRTNFVYTKVVEVTGQVFTDQTGRFPVTSSKGSQYIMVLYDYDSNAILAEPMKNRSERELVQVYTKMHTYLCRRGLKPWLQKLDNECPAGLKAFMEEEEIKYQLVPPLRPPTELRRTGDQHLEGPLHSGPSKTRSKFSDAPVVAPDRPGDAYPQPPPPGPYESAPVGGGIPEWRV